MVEVCKVCDEQPYLYRCPTCSIKYCSVNCWETHKVDGCKIKTPEVTVSKLNDYKFRTSIIPDHVLEKLRDDENIKTALRNNGHIRTLIRMIDENDRPQSCLRRALNKRYFNDFATTCLQIIDKPKLIARRTLSHSDV